MIAAITSEIMLDFMIALILMLLTAVGTLVIIIWRWLGNWMKTLDNRQDAQHEILIRMETRMERYDKLESKQEHDHKELRAMSDQLLKIENRLVALEQTTSSIKSFCQEQHNARL